MLSSLKLTVILQKYYTTSYNFPGNKIIQHFNQYINQIWQTLRLGNCSCTCCTICVCVFKCRHDCFAFQAAFHILLPLLVIFCTSFDNVNIYLYILLFYVYIYVTTEYYLKCKHVFVFCMYTSMHSYRACILV